jgi:hypothetical protein
VREHSFGFDVILERKEEAKGKGSIDRYSLEYNCSLAIIGICKNTIQDR